jgi:hypothetical protein
MKKALIATCVAGLAFVSAGAAFAQTDTTPKMRWGTTRWQRKA